MNAVDDILGQIPVDELAAQLGTDSASIEQAATVAIPQLFEGMQEQAQDPAGEQAIAGAIEDHGTRGLLDGGLNLDDVNVGEGEQIVSTLFGGSTQPAHAAGGLGGDLVKRLLPILAPIVLAYIAKQMTGGSAQQQGSGNILGDILGSVLGGGQQTASPGPNPGGGLGDILGQILGGGQPQVHTQPGGGTMQAPANPGPNSGDLNIDATPQAENERSSTSGGGLFDAIKNALGSKN